MSRGRDDTEYPAGTLTVGGVDHQIFTLGTGDWGTYIQGNRLTAGTRDKLRTVISRYLRGAAIQVAIPFVALEDRYSDRPRVRAGVAPGIHSGSRNTLVTWADGEKGQVTSYGSDSHLDGDADPAQWQRLIDEAARTAGELKAYTDAHKINLAQVVRAALDAAMAADEGGTGASTHD